MFTGHFTLLIKNSPFLKPSQVPDKNSYFFAPKKLLESLISCSTGNIVISDQAPVFMNVTVQKLSKKPMSWRMDSSILQDLKFISYFSTEFGHFLDINSPSATNSSILWKTSKAYARGLITSYTAFQKRRVMEQQVLSEKRYF